MVKILLLSFFTAMVFFPAGRAFAEDNRKASIEKTDKTESSNETAKQSNSTATAESTSSQQQSGSVSLQKSPKSASSFIDRDGDGIRDGKEHRFRRRPPRHGDSESRQMKQRRKQGSANAGNGRGGN